MKFNFHHRPDFIRNSPLLSRIFPKPAKPEEGGAQNAPSRSADLPSTASLGAGNARARVLRNLANAQRQGNPLRYRQVPDKIGFADLPPELLLEITKHLDFESMKNLALANRFSSEVLASSVLPSVARLMQQQADPEREGVIDAGVAELASTVEQINAAKARGKLKRDAAVKQTVGALLDQCNIPRRSDLASRIAVTPTLATALCELMPLLPTLHEGDRTRLLDLFAKAIKNDFTRFTQGNADREIPPDLAPLVEAFGSRATAFAFYDVVKLDDRIERAERLKEGITGLLHAYPKLACLRPEKRDPALEVLAMCHEFAAPDLKEKIAGELEKLPLETLVSCKTVLAPSVTEFARARILRDFDRLSGKEKSAFIDSFADDCGLGGTVRNRSLRREDVAALFRNLKQLVALDPQLHDETSSAKASAIIAQCLIHHRNMDDATRAALQRHWEA